MTGTSLPVSVASDELVAVSTVRGRLPWLSWLALLTQLAKDECARHYVLLTMVFIFSLSLSLSSHLADLTSVTWSGCSCQAHKMLILPHSFVFSLFLCLNTVDKMHSLYNSFPHYLFILPLVFIFYFFTETRYQQNYATDHFHSITLHSAHCWAIFPYSKWIFLWQIRAF